MTQSEKNQSGKKAAEENSVEQDKSYQNRLYPEDQARVDGFLKRGVNSVERKPFRPFLLVLLLLATVTSLSALSLFLANQAGVY